MTNDSSRFDELPPDDAAQFLKELDAALKSGAASGEQKDLAEFGARTARSLRQETPATPSAELRARVAAQLNAPPAGVARVGRLMQRWRIGVLDVAALLALAVLSVSLYAALRDKKSPQADVIAVVHAPAGDGDDKPKTPETPPVPEDPQIEGLRAQLQAPVQFDFVDITLEEALTAIRGTHKMDFILDPVLAADGILKTPVTIKTTGMTMEEALNWLCRLSDVRYTLKGGAVYLCRKNGQTQDQYMEAYDISKTGMPADLLVELIRDYAFPNEFADPARSISTVNGKLVLIQTGDVHKRVAKLLATLLEKAGSAEIPLLTPLPPAAWEKDIQDKLEKQISFDFVDTSLTEVLEFFRTQTGVNIVIDPRVLAAGQAPIQLKITDQKAKVALDWALRLENLEYTLVDHALFISTPTRKGDVTLYNVRDLLGEDEKELTKLQVLIQSGIAGSSMGGRAGILIASGSPEIQEKVHAFLAKLRGTGAKSEKPAVKR